MIVLIGEGEGREVKGKEETSGRGNARWGEAR
jgi:hypothetical protein